MFGRHNDQDEDQQASAAQHGDVEKFKKSLDA